jgi:hypothetical protein
VAETHYGNTAHPNCGPSTAASGSQDRGVFGACACEPQPADADDCRCQIRGLIDQLLVTAYHCEPELAAHRLRELIEQAPRSLTMVQASLMRRLAKDWTGTADEFCQRYGYTRQRLHQMGVRWRKS